MEENYMVEQDLTGGVIPVEVGGDYTLPDYMPEVRRVLRVDCQAGITGRYPSGDKTEVGGDCRYYMLYTGENGQISSAPLNGSFECLIPMVEALGGQIPMTIEGVMCRPAGPRRVSMKANLALRPTAVRKHELEDVVPQDEAGEVEVLRSKMQSAHTVEYLAEEISMTETLKGEPQSTLLSTDAKVLIREVKCEMDAVMVRGEVWLTALCNNGEGVPYTLTGKLPFDETIVANGVTPQHKGIGWGSVRNLATSFAGEEGEQLTVVLLLDLWGMAVKNQEISPVCDLYSLECPVRVTKSPLATRWYPGIGMGNFTVDASVGCDAMGIPAGCHIVDCRGEVTSSSGTIQGKEVVVEGEVRLHPIFKGEDSYLATTTTVPYKVRLHMPETLPDGTSLGVDVTCVGCHTRMDGTRMVADMELFATAIARKEETGDVVTEVALDTEHPFETRQGEILAVYLQNRDSLWEVGKRYHVGLKGLQNGNSLPEEILDTPDDPFLMDGLMRLLIER